MESKRTLCLLLAGLLSLFILNRPVLAQGPTPDPRFGIVEAYLNAQEATAAGAGYTRIILRWDLIQPAGRDDWKPANVPDPFIEAELEAGREIVAVLIGTPSWAGRESDSPKAVPDLEAWGNFTKRMAQQYQGRIKHWIIWNEPDVWDPNHPGHTWQGTAEDYVELLKSAYSNIKIVDPTMEVHLAGLTYHWDAQHEREQYLSRLLALITADPEAPKHNYYFDAVVYHLYHDPHQMFEILTEVRGILDAYRLGHKPIWVNETNAPPTDDAQGDSWAAPQLVVSSQEQAAFVIQAFALLIAGGAERIEFYKMRNSEAHPENIAPTGLLRADDSRRPAFAAYQVVTRYFSGYTDYAWFQQGGIYVITLDRQGQTTTILWNTTRQESTFTLNAIAPQALLVDQTGAETTISASNSAYTLNLPPATCSAGWCFIGGPPRVLVEAGSPDQRASLIPLAPHTPTPTPLPTATPTPTPTTTATPWPTNLPAPDKAALITRGSIATSMQLTRVTPIAQRAASFIEEIAEIAELAEMEALAAATDSLSPATLNAALSAVLNPSRITLLIVLGAILFTFFYFVQFRMWHHYRNG